MWVWILILSKIDTLNQH